MLEDESVNWNKDMMLDSLAPIVKEPFKATIGFAPAMYGTKIA